MISLEFTMERQPFHFAGFTVTALDCAHVRLHRGGCSGQGEGVIPIVFDITSDQVSAQLRHAQQALAAGQRAEALCQTLPPGPARNALDCALWDLRAKETGRDIFDLAELPPGPAELEVDETISLASPEEMAAAAAASRAQDQA